MHPVDAAVIALVLLIRKEHREWILIASFLALNLYLAASITSGNDGWQLLMHYSFGAVVYSVEDFTPYFSLKDYLRIYSESLFDVPGPGYFP